MKKLTFIYLGDYSLHEEKTLQEFDIPTIRLESQDFLQGNIKYQESISPAILRSKRIKKDEYSKIYSDLLALNLALVNDPELFLLHNSFEESYSMMNDFSPKTIFFPPSSEAMTIRKRIESLGFSLPLFVRSEIESAAKYVGIDGCIIKENIDTEINKCISNLNNNVKDYKTIIIKEVVEIRKNESGKNLEYRAIVINDDIICFDYDSTKLDSPNNSKIATEAQKIISEISRNGFKGAYFIDFALTNDDKVIIVECKDIINGTIQNITDFGKSLSNIL